MRFTLLAAVVGVIAVAQPQAGPYPPPATVEQSKVLSDAGAFSATHQLRLPNFISLRTTRRLQNDEQRPTELMVERFVDIEREEAYKILTLNGQLVSVLRDQLQNSPPSRELGAILRTIFLPQTETSFVWREWSTLRGREVYVFAYQVHAFKSKYHIEIPEESIDLTTAYHGLIFVDRNSHVVNRISFHADEIPQAFPIQDVSITLDYDYTPSGDVAFLFTGPSR